MPKLTKRVIEDAENREKPYFIFDKHLPGFCARIAPNGRRHYYAQYLRGKKTKRMPLGQHGIITTEQARDKAIAVMASVNDGNDPQAERSQKRKEPTVADLAQRYMEEHVHVHCKPSTAGATGASCSSLAPSIRPSSRSWVLVRSTWRFFSSSSAWILALVSACSAERYPAPSFKIA